MLRPIADALGESMDIDEVIETEAVIDVRCLSCLRNTLGDDELLIGCSETGGCLDGEEEELLSTLELLVGFSDDSCAGTATHGCAEAAEAEAADGGLPWGGVGTRRVDELSVS